MVVSCNNSINSIYYNDHAIKKVYGCDGRLVWSGDTPTPPHDYSKDYLTFTANEKVSFAFHFAIVPTPLWYSINGGSWVKLDNDNRFYTPTVNAGDKIQWKGTLTPSQATLTLYGIGKFISYNENNVEGLGKYTVEGNIMSLMYSDEFDGETSLSGKDQAFNRLFSASTELEDAENLVLPATTLSQGCYGSMFYGCTSLKTAPTLPALTLVNSCYAGMFHNCTNLSKIKCLATDISATSCTNWWVDGVSQSGTFIKNASMSSWSSGDSGIPNGWTVQDA